IVLAENVERPTPNVQHRIAVTCRGRRVACGVIVSQPARLPLQKRSRLRPPQCKTVIRRFPQTQANEPLSDAIIEFRPKRAHDSFSRGRRLAKILRFEIEMAIPPWLKR